MTMSTCRASVFDRMLTVGRGIADVCLGWLGNVGKALFQRGDDFGTVVQRERGLGDVCQIVRILHVECTDVCRSLYQLNAGIDLSHGALHFRVPAVTDHDDFPAGVMHADDLHMDFHDKRAGGIEYAKLPFFGFAANGL